MPAFSAVAISAFTLLLGGRKASSLQKLSGEVLTWLSVWSKCKWFAMHMVSWCHCHPIISCSSKIQNGLPFWCRLTQVVLERGHFTDVVVVVYAWHIHSLFLLYWSRCWSVCRVRTCYKVSFQPHVIVKLNYALSSTSWMVLIMTPSTSSMQVYIISCYVHYHYTWTLLYSI